VFLLIITSEYNIKIPKIQTRDAKGTKTLKINGLNNLRFS